MRIGTTPGGAIELVDVAAILIESKTASLAGTIRKDDDILAHCEIFL